MATAMSGHETATPGRWVTTVGGILAEDPDHDRKWSEVMSGTDNHAESYGVKVAENVTPDDARLICAAVNACREAGYTVEELETGMVRQGRILQAESLKCRYHHDAERSVLRADLAACREALVEIYEEVQEWMTDREPDLGDMEKVRNIARALLARADADKGDR